MSDWRDGLSLVEQQAYMLKHEINCDCTFTVGCSEDATKVFKAHKLILARASSVFEAMLLGGLRESNGQVRITDLTPRTFHLLLRHTYTDNVQLSSCDEAHDLALAADKYLLLTLKERCADYLASNVTPASVWRTLALSQLLQHKKLKDVCVKIMLWETPSCLTSEDFVSIPEETLLLLLEQDCLNSNSEIQLIEATVNWARKEAERRGGSVLDSAVREILQPRLLSKLRFLALKPEDFANGPAVSNWLTDAEKTFIFVNLISPGKANIMDHLCCNAKPRISLVKLASDDAISNAIVKHRPEDMFRFTRPIVHLDNNFFNSGNANVSFSIKTNSNVWIVSLQLSGQLKNDNLMKSNPSHFSVSGNCYNESIYYNVSEYKGNALNVYLSRCYFCEGHFSSTVNYNSQFTINFPKELYLENGKEYIFDIQFKKLGYYPTRHRSDFVNYGGIDFQFDFSTTDSTINGCVQGITFKARYLDQSFINTNAIRISGSHMLWA